MKFTAVQMIGTQRSGSNLLRLMLNQLPEVSAPHPPHILQLFLPLLPAYGDLNVDENFSLLVHDVCSLVANNPVKWQHISLKQNEIIQRCTHPSLTEIIRVIYEMKAESENAHIWLCKSLGNIHYADLLEESIRPLYIFLYRDGRDVACSFKRAVVGEKHAYYIAKQWQREQELCMALQQKAGNERVIGVCYENLIKQPEKELNKICAFIGVQYSSSCLDYYNSEEARNTASSGKMWQNVSRDIISGNFNNYRKELSASDIFLFESVACKTLQTLGYRTEFFCERDAVFSNAEIKIFDRHNELLKQKAKQQQLYEDAEKRKMQEALLNNIKKKKHPAFSCSNVEKIAV